MKKNLLFLLFALCLTPYMYGQTTILDFETIETSANCNYFGMSTSQNDTQNTILPNPATDGVNGSATVAEFIKAPNSEVWGGAWHSEPFADLDFAGGANQVCVKVWMPHIGNLAVKLENSDNDGPNWILTKENTVVNGWEELCFDVVLPSIELPNQPADDFNYAGLVFFFDFGSSSAETATYYYDDVVVQEGTVATDGDITFSVDMSDYPDPVTSVQVFGTFNGWDPTNIQMTDGGSGIWTVTVPDLAIGAHEYKFSVNDDGNSQESLSRYGTCVTVFDDGGGNVFVNRTLAVAGDKTLDTVCWESCYECGASAKFTIALGTSNITVSPEGVFIAGGGNFGGPGDNPLLDADGDGIYTATFEREIGFSSFYTFTNGACGDFSCKEDIAGQDCADPNNFNDRFLDPVMEDLTVATCFGICTDSADDCGAGNNVEVLFQVDMSDYTDAFTNVYISGSFNGWSGDANVLTDIGNGRYETTLTLPVGEYEYKFQVDAWADDEGFTMGDPCTVTSDGVNTNRYIDAQEDMTVCFFWETCNTCAVGTNNVTIDHTLFSLQPSITSNETTILFKEGNVDAKQINVYNTVGKLMMEMNVEGTTTQQQISTADFANGLYIISVQIGDTIGTQKLIKQ